MARRKEPAISAAILDQLLAGADAKTAFDQGGPLDSLKKALTERALNAEMDHHLDGEGGFGNGRNGYGRKTVATETGKLELEIPRDRQSSFDPSDYAGSPDDPDNDPVVGPLLDAICEELRPIRARLADMTPATLAGARAMARAALAEVPRTSDYALLTGDDPLLYAATEWLAGDYAAYLATPPGVRDFAAPPSVGEARV
jgi:hypothetical protein